MRAMSGGVILFPPDVQGMLGAGALIRMLGPEYDLLAVSPHEATRRLYGLSAEPVPRRVYVVDVVPTDSLDTLLVPALHRFVGSGAPATWIYGRLEPPTLLEGLGDIITLHVDEGREAWRIVVRMSGDQPYLKLADAIEAREEGPGMTWRMVLSAVASSWDWRRVYSAVTGLARLVVPEPGQRTWAVEQLNMVDRAMAALEKAPVRDCEGLKVAVVDDPEFSAKVRPEALQGVRTDVDAIAFIAGPGRLRVIAARQNADLSVLNASPGLLQLLQDGGAISGSITTPRAEFSWLPDEDVPAPICALLDLELFRTARPVESARIERPFSERRAKGIDPSRLAPQDLQIIREALGGDGRRGMAVHATDRGTPVPVRTGAPGLSEVRPPAYHTSIEIQVVPTKH
jgi:hypothetical protein